MEKKEHSYTLGENLNCYSNYAEQYEYYLKKPETRASIWSSNPNPGHKSGEHHNLKDTWKPVLIAALFTIARTWKQPKRNGLEKCGIYI